MIILRAYEESSSTPFSAPSYEVDSALSPPQLPRTPLPSLAHEAGRIGGSILSDPDCYSRAERMGGRVTSGVDLRTRGLWNRRDPHSLAIAPPLDVISLHREHRRNKKSGLPQGHAPYT